MNFYARTIAGFLALSVLCLFMYGFVWLLNNSPEFRFYLMIFLISCAVVGLSALIGSIFFGPKDDDSTSGQGPF